MQCILVQLSFTRIFVPSLWKITTRPPLSPVAKNSPSWLNSTVEIMSAEDTEIRNRQYTRLNVASWILVKIYYVLSPLGCHSLSLSLHPHPTFLSLSLPLSITLPPSVTLHHPSIFPLSPSSLFLFFTPTVSTKTESKPINTRSKTKGAKELANYHTICAASLSGGVIPQLSQLDSVVIHTDSVVNHNRQWTLSELWQECPLTDQLHPSQD